MRTSVEQHSRMPVEKALWDDFASGSNYQQGDFSDPANDLGVTTQPALFIFE